ncbi:hypothetical protein JD844_031330 [Phrynosoma platyrhinos]|uniref:BPTI/Kunitz inhibitor domain-containing protein n=1 Tax=Phrynosoma platyrhinos TaxID=52577 RepID=A0ABQ7T0S4_PHRPL|nr:hypothetical protein JD844_031330 [Phrynosoma platyrhinos]
MAWLSAGPLHQAIMKQCSPFVVCLLTVGVLFILWADLLGVPGKVEAMSAKCSYPMDPGSGTKQVRVYYYSVTYKKCDVFTYYGQGGNTNRFQDQHTCNKMCGG